MRRIVLFTSRLLLCLLFTPALQSCCIHLWPDPLEEELTPQMLLHLKFNPDFYVWEHLYDADTETVTERYPDQAVRPDFPGTTDVYDNTRPSGLIRHTLRVYPAGDAVNYIKEVKVSDVVNGLYDCDIPLELPAGNYDVVVWSDLRENSDADYFYNVGNFLSINLDRHEGNNDYRDAFRGKISLTVTDLPQQEATVEMWRPMAKFEFVATGLKAAIERETARTEGMRVAGSRVEITQYSVTFSYPMYMPASYSAVDDRLVDSKTGISFPGKIRQISDDEISLGFDYVMINAIERRQTGSRDAQGVSVMVEVRDPYGEVVARSSIISVPLRRDNHTVIRSDFLSKKADGGVTIDPDYDGDHNVFL